MFLSGLYAHTHGVVNNFTDYPQNLPSFPRRLLAGHGENWRKSWYYEYNYQKQFPYTPNVRGVRTDE